MILEIANLVINSDRVTEFEETFLRARKYILAADGYLGDNLHRCIEKKGEYVLLVRWENIDAHECGFRGSPGYQAYRELISPFFEAAPTVLHYGKVIVD